MAVPAGCFFGLLGPNGAGKTTLIGAVCGLVRAEPVRIAVRGLDPVSDPAARLAVGLAPQEIHLDRFLSARDVLVYHGRYFGLRRADAAATADELLAAFELTARRGRLRTGSRAGCAAGS